MPAVVNLAVAFAPVEIDLTIGHITVTVPAHPASVWLLVLTGDSLDGLDIIPGLLTDEDQDRVDELIFGQQLDMDQLTGLIYDLITEVSGHPWWWVFGLLSVLKGIHGTELLGEMARFDATAMSLAGWVNALYAILVQHQKPEDRIRFDAELDMPPPGIEAEISEAEQKATESTFFSMMKGG